MKSKIIDGFRCAQPILHLLVMTTKNDNRMGWIRNLERPNEGGNGQSIRVYEHELLSECEILGLLDYENSKILCSLYTLNKSKDGLYFYLLKIAYPECSDDHVANYIKNATKKGYYFKGNIVGELMVLFSIFFRCRFYLNTTTCGELSSTGIKTKTIHEFTRIQCEPVIHPPIFSSEARNFAVGLKEFIDKVKNLPSEYHQQFILAGYHYLLALREVGINQEMVFIRLVSAIEALSKSFELDPTDDPLKGKDFDNVVESLNCKLNKEEKDALKNIFETRKSEKKFTKFIENYSKGYIKGGNHKAKHCKIKKGNLSKILKTIYNARSNYLHSGEPMYLSMAVRNEYKWDIDPSLGMIADNRKIPASQKLPYAYWFEGLVRHCLVNFLEEKTKSGMPVSRAD